jgi:hypothetical protein
MLKFVVAFLCFIASVYGTVVQVWDANNKLLDSVSECNTNYFPPSNTHRFYVNYGGQWVDWYNADDSFIFVSKSSGYVNYGTSGNAANNFMISC